MQDVIVPYRTEHKLTLNAIAPWTLEPNPMQDVTALSKTEPKQTLNATVHCRTKLKIIHYVIAHSLYKKREHKLKTRQRIKESELKLNAIVQTLWEHKPILNAIAHMQNE